MKLTIEVKKWLHGSIDSSDGQESSLLRVDDKKMCCLGFYLKACGMPESKLLGKPSPADISKTTIPDQAKWLLDGGDNNSLAAERLMKHNDYRADRRRIKAEFAKHGVEVEFV